MGWGLTGLSPQNEWNSYHDELVYCLEEIDYVIKNLPEWVQDEHVEKTAQTQQDECYIHSEPLGVALIIGTWNYPFDLTVQPMVGAIAAGADRGPGKRGREAGREATVPLCGGRAGLEKRRWAGGVRAYPTGAAGTGLRASRPRQAPTPRGALPAAGRLPAMCQGFLQAPPLSPSSPSHPWRHRPVAPPARTQEEGGGRLGPWGAGRGAQGR